MEKEADAEALFWEVRVEDEVTANYARAVRRHYRRVKIFTERGKETQGQVDLVFGKKVEVSDIAARTIRFDGQVVELQKDDVHERVIQKQRGVRVSAKSFALPGVEPGAIVEYRWKESYYDQLTSYVALPLQLDIPIWRIQYSVKPFADPDFPYPMTSQAFNIQPPKWVKERDFYVASFEKIPAFKEEPHMPPEDQVRSWLLLYYVEKKEQTPEAYWKDHGRAVYKEYKGDLKATPEILAAAEKIVEGAATPSEKAARLVEFCRTKIKNVSDDAVQADQEEKTRARKNRTPQEVLQRGVGDSAGIDTLFTALAAASGLDARIAMASDRSEIFFDAALQLSFFLRAHVVAVRDGETWQLYEPSSRYTPAGSLRWQNQGVRVLVTDSKEPFFVASPMSLPPQSFSKRTATLKLSESGVLEGDVRLEHSGHAGGSRKEIFDDESTERREEVLRDWIQEPLAGAEVTNIAFENVTDPEKPIVTTYHVRVPDYAPRTGKRLFVQPAIFQKGRRALFPAQERRHLVYFDYPWSEQDDVRIELPAGFELDHPEAPPAVMLGELAHYEVKMSIARPSPTLVYKRTMHFGGQGQILFPLEAYDGLKQLFDNVHAGDAHVLTLRQVEAAAAGAAR